jgi:hypothetical protein
MIVGLKIRTFPHAKPQSRKEKRRRGKEERGTSSHLFSPLLLFAPLRLCVRFSLAVTQSSMFGISLAQS